MTKTAETPSSAVQAVIEHSNQVQMLVYPSLFYQLSDSIRQQAAENHDKAIELAASQIKK